MVNSYAFNPLECEQSINFTWFTAVSTAPRTMPGIPGFCECGCNESMVPYFFILLLEQIVSISSSRMFP